MPATEKDSMSHRGRALRKLYDYLASFKPDQLSRSLKKPQ
jgi:hypothetical protein